MFYLYNLETSGSVILDQHVRQEAVVTSRITIIMWMHNSLKVEKTGVPEGDFI